MTVRQMVSEGVGLPLLEHKYGHLGAKVEAIACANIECLEVSMTVSLSTLRVNPSDLNLRARDQYDQYATTPFEIHRLRPEGMSKQQPDFIPAPLREDYFEACSIRLKSPKSSATLARRCLQGMIRHFCGITKDTLNQEIKELKKRINENTAPKGVTEESLEAIDAVRSIGNIGAHMEKDINIIVDVDPGEAQALIELIELLFEEWYVAQNKREKRLARVTAIAAEKRAEIAEAKLNLLPTEE